MSPRIFSYKVCTPDGGRVYGRVVAVSSVHVHRCRTRASVATAINPATHAANHPVEVL
jgi:hypothetical protein